MTKATQKTSRNRAATLKAVDSNAETANRCDLVLEPDEPVDMLTVAAAANEARLMSNQARTLDRAGFGLKRDDERRLRYQAQERLADRRATAMKDTAMMLLAANPFEALMQTVYVWNEVHDVAFNDLGEAEKHQVLSRIDHALESIMRALERASGRSRNEAGAHYVPFESHRPFMVMEVPGPVTAEELS